MGNKKGIALVMVLWVLAIMMVIVLSFSFAVRVETHSTLSFKEDAEKRFLAEAGIERGIMEVFYRNANKGQRTILEGMEVWNIDGKPYRVQTDNGFYTVSITDESGKVDINITPDVILRNLLINLGLELENVDTIVDSIMDWKDPDELHRLHGAESDYYMLLPNPYKVKNANFDTLEELLLVKGVTPGILHGTKEKKGIMNFLTVNSGTGAININAASREVLMAVPGITPEVADEIITQRQIKEISYFQEIKGIPEENYPLVEPYVTTEGAHTFAIESVGYKSNKKAGYGIKAIIVVIGNDKYNYLYYKRGT
ncbi:MAG: general secretion pathway protein GspK [Nitrospirae bacterium]|nr:general secretion pathway protein GspK [Nitrospirota bacterium]